VRNIRNEEKSHLHHKPSLRAYGGDVGNRTPVQK